MNLFDQLSDAVSKLDSRTVGFFQELVDESELKPEIWARRSVMALGFFTAAWFMMAGDRQTASAWITLFLGVVACSIYWLLTLSSPRFRLIGSMSWARMLLALYCLRFAIGAIGFDIRMLWDLSFQVSSLSYLYFAACESPRPRIRRERKSELKVSYAGF